jgi:hypothetical protein
MNTNNRSELEINVRPDGRFMIGFFIGKKSYGLPLLTQLQTCPVIGQLGDGSFDIK